MQIKKQVMMKVKMRMRMGSLLEMVLVEMTDALFFVFVVEPLLFPAGSTGKGIETAIRRGCIVVVGVDGAASGVGVQTLASILSERIELHGRRIWSCEAGINDACWRQRGCWGG
jgi:hypothetical protein